VNQTTEQLLANAALELKQLRFAEARRHLSSAVSLLEHEESPLVLAGALRKLAEVERKLRDYHAAGQHYEAAVALYRQAGNDLMLAHTVRHLGDVYYEQGRPDLAQPCLEEALNLYRQNSDSPTGDLANAIRSMAVLGEATGDKATARALWQEAGNLYSELGISEGVKESSRRLERLAE
jgi:tetratricopeptide (TPR) repeat protein